MSGRDARYNTAMLWLRRGWLGAIACALLVAGGSALLLRFELVSPEPTTSPELYGRALGLHGMLALGALVAALLAIPTIILTPGRGAAMLGAIALALWGVAVVWLTTLDWLWYAPGNAVLVLAASLAFGAAQIAVSLPRNTADRTQLLAGGGALLAIALLAIPLARRELPNATYWLLATTAICGGVGPDALKREGASLAVVASALCLAWSATVLVDVVDVDYFHDTTAVVAPLPVMGAALFGALLLAATRLRTLDRTLAQLAIALTAAGSILTSLAFFILGSRRMPRRYFAYLPEFQSMHVVVGVAALIAAVGAVLSVAAFARGQRG